MEKITQPEWNRPQQAAARPVLKIYNSLTRSKEEFVPLRKNRVTWYSCGPTVYDSSHMGHARNYVTTDINRRLLQNYFGYDVLYVQNITDIDDKIIVRGRQNYLFEQFATKLRSQSHLDDQTTAHGRTALENYASSAFDGLNLDVPLTSKAEFTHWLSKQDKAALTLKDPKFPMNATAVESALSALESKDVEEYLQGIESVLVKLLDKELGSEVTDHSVFRKLSSFFEADFEKDMKELNVLPSDVTTRVSEYVPEIVAFVKQIVDRGYAYAAEDGSVYFDVAAFEANPDHDYAKLQPWNKGVQELIDEGEGSLSLKASGKKSRSDFALWKASKPGEPAWESPWGMGRPGWHIECSVMASHILGPQIDIHSGGIDLAFPHHDNELAQSEACFDCPQWINYFMHNGHLHIEGQKMSKSLKNFITIKEALAQFSSRQLRLAFAFQPWNTQLDFKMSLSHVKAFESTATNFFNKVKALSRELTETTPKHVAKAEIDLLDELYKTQLAVDEAFADNLSVYLAFQHIGSLIQKANEYVSGAEHPKAEVLLTVAKWVTKIFNILGFETSEVGWSTQDGYAVNKEDIALPYLQILASFREDVRQLAMAGEKPNQELLALCDRVRDTDLLDACVALDDRKGDKAALIKFLSEDERDEILMQRKALAAAAEEKAKQKAEKQKQAEEQERLKREKAKIPPQDMFRGLSEYSKFDEKGVPTHDAEGEPLSKSATKKLQKQWLLQDKLYKQYN